MPVRVRLRAPNQWAGPDPHAAHTLSGTHAADDVHARGGAYAAEAVALKNTVEVQPVVPERKTRRVIGATLRAFEQVRVLRLDALKRLADALRQCDVDELAGMLKMFVTTKSGLRT